MGPLKSKHLTDRELAELYVKETQLNHIPFQSLDEFYKYIIEEDPHFAFYRLNYRIVELFEPIFILIVRLVEFISKKTNK